MKRFLIWLPQWYKNNKRVCLGFFGLFTGWFLATGIYDRSVTPSIWYWAGCMGFGLFFLVLLSYFKRNSP